MTRTLRDRIVNNVRNRTRTFTSTHLSTVLGVSDRHTRRVLAEMVELGWVTRLGSGVYSTLPNNTTRAGRA